MSHLINSVNVDENETLRDIFMFLLLTGVRKMNAQTMRWEDIIWERNEWRIPDTKNGEALTIPLSLKAIEILKNRDSRAKSRWVFPQENDPDKHIINLKRGWKRILERASLNLIRNDVLLGDWICEREKKLIFLKSEELYRELKRQAEKKKIEWPNDMMDIRIHDIQENFLVVTRR
ncbi:MAG: tyrosine-type recombinase/integrase [Bacteroidetes bacterium]|nr:tyrosine-type recombinase/integrase [Bacteroidota bacterium]